MGFGATGYAADVLEECVRADVNIVETVAHMMSAVHFFGDVDVICDIGGQDIKVLFMKNGDIAQLPPLEQLLGRQRHAAAGDGRLVRRPGHRSSPTSRSRPSSRRSSRYGCAVFLDTDRVNFQKEGFSQGGDARRPRAGAAEERLAVRRADPAHGRARDEVRPAGRHAVQPRRRQGAGRLHQGARPGRRGLRPPAHGRGRRDRRRDGDAARRQAHAARRRSSASMRRSTSSTRRKNDEETRLPLLPEQLQAHVHRHEAARRLDQPLHRRLLLREGHRRERRRRCSRSSRSARRSRKQFPNLRRLRVEAARSCTSTTRRRCRAEGSPIEDVEVEEGHLRHAARRR